MYNSNIGKIADKTKKIQQYSDFHMTPGAGENDRVTGAIPPPAIAQRRY